MTTRPRRSIPLVLGTAAVLALSGCTSTSDGSPGPSPTGKAATGTAPAAVGSTTCRDRQRDVASLAPGSISTDPGTWGSGSTMAKIKARGHLIVGTSGDAKLWGARDPVSGRIEGFDVDVAAQVARALGLKPSGTVFKVLTIAQRVPALRAGTVDLVAERMTISCDRWQGSAKNPTAYVNLSTAYYLSGARLLVREDSKAESLVDLANQTVCGVAGSTSLESLERADATNQVTKLVVSEPGRCLVKFQEGEADAVVGDDTTLAGLADQDQYAKIIGEPLDSSPIGIGLHPEADDFTRFVNLVLEQMRADGSLAALYTRWMKPAVGVVGLPAVPKPVYGRELRSLDRQS